MLADMQLSAKRTAKLLPPQPADETTFDPPEDAAEISLTYCSEGLATAVAEALSALTREDCTKEEAVRLALVAAHWLATLKLVEHEAEIMYRQDRADDGRVGGKAKSTADRDVILARLFLSARAATPRKISDTAIKTKIVRQEGLTMTDRGAREAVNRGLKKLGTTPA